MLEQVNRRFIFGFLLVAGFGACGYEAPTAGESVASASSSSSGAGGMGGAEQSSSSSTSDGGGGLIPSSGAGGFGGFAPDAGVVGGAGGSVEMTSTSASASSSGGVGGSGSVADPIVSNCENGDCHTAPALTICCKAKAVGGSNNCTQAFGTCLNPADYAMECDDKADCGANAVCCMEFGRAECQSSCNGTIVCKTEADCPMGQACIIPGGTVMFCGQK